jgi:hypothetical protein
VGVLQRETNPDDRRDVNPSERTDEGPDNSLATGRAVMHTGTERARKRGRTLRLARRRYEADESGSARQKVCERRGSAAV